MPAASPLKVMVVDDHLGIRLGIERLIEAEAPRMRCVGTAASADEALQRVRELQPEVVVLDVDLGGEDGLALIPLLRRDAPCRIVVLTSLLDPRVSALARRWGAHGFVHKTAPASELLACIVDAADAPGALLASDPSSAGSVNEGSGMSHAAWSKRPSESGN
jgi:DNA-binding NarL/FixJ family response regulator